jgi:Ca2+/Na+ antiporter
VEGAAGAAATLIAAAVLLGWLSAIAGAVALACVLVPYLLLVTAGTELLSRLHRASGFVNRLARALSQRGQRDRPQGATPDPARHLLGLIVLDVGLIVAGSTGMVETALTLGDHWQVSRPILGVLILAPLTSIPNAITAVRLGLARRGAALVGETFNSNTLNLAAGVTAPALFVSLTTLSSTERADLGWLVAMTAATILLLARTGTMRRPGGAVILCLYVGFVVLQLASI